MKVMITGGAGASTPDASHGANGQERILLFIPCYNCARQIGRVLAQVQGPVASFVDEVLVLDNGSHDGTVEAAIAAAPRAEAPVRIGLNRDNYNLGGSHKAAFAYAHAHDFSHIIILHGDDQGDLADLLPILELNLHRRFDACLGARFMRGSQLSGYSRFRTIGNRAFNFIFSLAARRPVKDIGSGLNLLSRTVFSDSSVTNFPDDLRFNVYLLLSMFGNVRNVTFFPITWREDDQISNVKLASQAIRTLAAPLRYAFARHTFNRVDYRSVPRNQYQFDVITEFR